MWLRPIDGHSENGLESDGAASHSQDTALEEAPALRPDPNGADFLWPLYSYKNPTFPTFEAEVIDCAQPIVVG